MRSTAARNNRGWKIEDGESRSSILYSLFSTIFASRFYQFSRFHFLTTYQLFCMSCASSCFSIELKPVLARYSPVFSSPRSLDVLHEINAVAAQSAMYKASPSRAMIMLRFRPMAGATRALP